MESVLSTRRSSVRSRKRPSEGRKLLRHRDLLVAENSLTYSKKEKGREFSAITSADAPSCALGAVTQSVGEYLLIEDGDVLPLLLAAVAAHWLDCSPVWLMLVGPPSSAKTELITLLTAVKHVYFLSDLSPNTLASGFNVRAG